MDTNTTNASQEDTLRQILQQKWCSIEHLDRVDQNFLVSVFALSGAAVALGNIDIPPDTIPFVYWLAVFLSAAAIVMSLRHFVEYHRALGIICRVEIALGVSEIVGEKPHFPENDSILAFSLKLFYKFSRTWRVSLVIIYGSIGYIALTLSVGNINPLWGILFIFIYISIVFYWFVIRPLKDSVN